MPSLPIGLIAIKPNTMIELYPKAKAYFDHIYIPERGINANNEHRLTFLDQVYNLSQHIVTKDDNFRSLFIGRWDNYNEDYWTNGYVSIFWKKGMTVSDIVIQGASLNPEHPLVKNIPHWKEVNEVEL